MTLMGKLKEAGYPEADMFHHGADLYIYASDMTQRVINEWFREAGLNRTLFVSTFKDNITGRTMYDIAFQYTPAWSDNTGRGDVTFFPDSAPGPATIFHDLDLLEGGSNA